MVRWINSVRAAISGCISFFRDERNGQIELGIAVLVILVSYVLGLSSTEWMILIMCIGLVLAAEAFNTAIEKLCDFVHPNIDSKIKTIKDVSAGAVLILS